MEFVPKIGDEYFYFKPCGAVRCDIWLNHPEQIKKVIRGVAPFRSRADASAEFKKLKHKKNEKN